MSEQQFDAETGVGLVPTPLPGRQPADGRVPAIQVRGLCKVYGRLVAVDDVSLTMYRGEAFGFLGPNGAGKSTVVKVLTGLIAPTAGVVRVLGHPVTHLEPRRRVGYLPELPNFHRWLRAREFLEFHGRLYGLRDAALRQRCAETLELVGLAGRDRQKLGTFSRGMLQRIGLAQALLNRPDLLILDEPASGLDPIGQRDMREVVLRLKREGMSIFLNSHQLADVEVICDRVAIINRGRILKVGPPDSLFDEPVTLDVRVNAVSTELLRRLGAVALAVQQDGADSHRLLIEVRGDEDTADVAAVIHACGARLYTLAPRRRSLEQLFLRTIETQ
jgi:ABC-2 type transport system ATP-binding protein